MNTILLLNGLVGGVIFGAIYALIGCSLNVLCGVLRVVNFAHGAVNTNDPPASASVEAFPIKITHLAVITRTLSDPSNPSDIAK